MHENPLVGWGSAPDPSGGAYSASPDPLGKLSLAFLWGRLIEYQLRLGQGRECHLAGRQVTLCDPMWHVSSRSGVAILRTAIHLLLTYLLTYLL